MPDFLAWMNGYLVAGCAVGIVLGYFWGRRRGFKQGIASKDVSGKGSNTSFANAALDGQVTTDKENSQSIFTATSDSRNHVDQESPVERDDVKVEIVKPIAEQEVDPDATRDKMFAVEEKPVESTTVDHGTAYLSTPTADGEFDDEQRCDAYRPGNSMYQIFYTDEQRTVGEFELMSTDDALDLALRRREQVIDLVADMSNAYRDGVRSVVVDQRGDIELVGGVWKVRRKMIGHYE